MTEKIYLIRYYDYDHEGSPVEAAFKSETSVLAHIADKYAGRVDMDDWGNRDFDGSLFLLVNGGDYGAKLTIQEIEVAE